MSTPLTFASPKPNSRIVVIGRYFDLDAQARIIVYQTSEDSPKLALPLNHAVYTFLMQQQWVDLVIPGKSGTAVEVLELNPNGVLHIGSTGDVASQFKPGTPRLNGRPDNVLTARGRSSGPRLSDQQIAVYRGPSSTPRAPALNTTPPTVMPAGKARRQMIFGKITNQQGSVFYVGKAVDLSEEQLTMPLHFKFETVKLRDGHLSDDYRKERGINKGTQKFEVLRGKPLGFVVHRFDPNVAQIAKTGRELSDWHVISETCKTENCPNTTWREAMRKTQDRQAN